MEVAWPAVSLDASEKASGHIYFACGFAVAMNEAGIARAVMARMGNCGEFGKPPDVRCPQFHTGGAVDRAGTIDPGGLGLAGPKRRWVE